MQSQPYELSLVWFRRDLRLHDHNALAAALRLSRRVAIAFVFDTAILDALEDKDDQRVAFIWESLQEIQSALEAMGGMLWVAHGDAQTEIPELALKLGAQAVFTNRDYEPSAILRDEQVERTLGSHNIDFHHFKDQVIFEKDEILTAGRMPYSVFTPYKNAWLKQLDLIPVQTHDVSLQGKMHRDEAAAGRDMALPSLAALGFGPSRLANLNIRSGTRGGQSLLEDFSGRIGRYQMQRDYPAIKGPSYLSVHLRFGTISIRQAVRLALRARDTQPEQGQGAATWLSELIWRDFYFQILYHHPRVVTHCFKPAYDSIRWHEDPTLFDAFCQAQTGYPLVDAAMEQLNQTGYMHNRLRMVVASFLTKDLGLDWRLGEARFARKLIDYDLAANNGGWQWAASTGCDAQPYFRIFNPVTQSEKFDPQGKFIRRYLPQLAALSDKAIHAPWLANPETLRSAGVTLGQNYPFPVVDHASARQSTLERYQVVKA